MAFVEYVLAGLGVGLIFGMFGAGGSAFATPVLALMGVPAILAVASPLPAMLPASYAGARRYLRSGHLDTTVAIAAVSLVLSPGTWDAWLARLTVESGRADPGPWAGKTRTASCRPRRWQKPPPRTRSRKSKPTRAWSAPYDLTRSPRHPGVMKTWS